MKNSDLVITQRKSIFWYVGIGAGLGGAILVSFIIGRFLAVDNLNESIEFEDTYSFLGYNPPFQLLNRKNEVIIPLTNYKVK